MKLTKSKLPDKPSKLLNLALNDLEKVEKSRKYIVQMAKWHVPTTHGRGKGKCAVCLAGAVMAYSLSAYHTSWTMPGHFTQKDKLLALDQFRRGEIDIGLSLMLKTPYNFEKRIMIRITAYEDDPKQFKLDMKNVIKRLKELE